MKKKFVITIESEKDEEIENLTIGKIADAIDEKIGKNNSIEIEVSIIN